VSQIKDVLTRLVNSSDEDIGAGDAVSAKRHVMSDEKGRW